MSSLNPKHLSGRFIRAVCPPVWGLLHLKGPRLVKRCQARSIDHLHAPTACLHLVVKQNCAALRKAFVFSLASGCPVKRLFGVDQKSTRVVAADVSYVITHRQLPPQAITLTTPAWDSSW
jgi:hypothetical protein